MLDKLSGSVAYAVIKTGGLLGTHRHYPVPWRALGYDPQRQVYETELTMDELRSGPSEFDDEAFGWGDRARFYPHPHYWTFQRLIRKVANGLAVRIRASR